MTAKQGAAPRPAETTTKTGERAWWITVVALVIGVIVIVAVVAASHNNGGGGPAAKAVNDGLRMGGTAHINGADVTLSDLTPNAIATWILLNEKATQDQSNCVGLNDVYLTVGSQRIDPQQLADNTPCNGLNSGESGQVGIAFPALTPSAWDTGVVLHLAPEQGASLATWNLARP